MTVLVDNQMPLLIELLAPYTQVVPFEGRMTSTASVAALRERIISHNAAAIIVRSTTLVNQALLRGTPVRFVATATAGIDHVDTEYLRTNNIAFAGAPGSNANAVAEYVMLAIDIWRHNEYCPLERSYTATLGIVGCGNVGRRLALHAHAAGMNVLVSDPPLADLDALGDVVGVVRDLRSLLASSDIVSLHVPLTHTGAHATANMMDAEHIALIRQGALFVNTSRGGLVDEEALQKRLETRAITSVLDVYNNEPAIDIQLIALALIATPHVAGYTIEAKNNAARMVGVALLRWLGKSSASFVHAINSSDNASSEGRDLVADTIRMHDALRDKSAVSAFDLLRKTYPLKHEALRDPF